jgi:uncharacterized coiled-coil DUF342 family protein
LAGTSVFEAVFDDDQFDALLYESEQAARLAHRLRQRFLAAERSCSADLDELRRQADEARAVADELQRRLGATANRLVAHHTGLSPARRRFERRRRRRLTPSVESSRA